MSLVVDVLLEYFLCWFPTVTDGYRVVQLFVLNISVQTLAGLEAGLGQLLLFTRNKFVVAFISFW